MTDQELSKGFDELEADSNFISEKMTEFAQKYAKKFVAIKNRQIVAIGDNFEILIEEVKQKGIDPSRILIEYIPDKGEIILY